VDAKVGAEVAWDQRGVSFVVKLKLEVMEGAFTEF
jgi:hypothetical protein